MKIFHHSWIYWGLLLTMHSKGKGGKGGRRIERWKGRVKRRRKGRRRKGRKRKGKRTSEHSPVPNLPLHTTVFNIYLHDSLPVMTMVFVHSNWI